MGRVCLLIVLLVSIVGALIEPKISAAVEADDILPTARGVEINLLVTAAITESIAEPLSIQVTRQTLPQGLEIDSLSDPSSMMLVVEKGEVILTDDLGIEGSYQAGSGLFAPAGATFDLRAAEQETRLLRVRIGDALNEIPSEEDDVFETVFNELPKVSSNLVVMRATWEGKGDGRNVSSNGAISLLMEKGTLRGSGFVQGDITKGTHAEIPPGELVRFRNRADSTATALIIAVVPQETPLWDPVSEEEAGGAALTSLEPGGVAYRADESTGFEGWDLPEGWKVQNGLLLFDGGSDSALVSPYKPGKISDYAITAEVQILRASAPGGGCQGAAGLFARSSSEGEYVANLEGLGQPGEACAPVARIRAVGDVLAESKTTVNNDWHELRLEVQVNVIRFLLDGTLIAETQDNRFLDGGNTGIRSSFVQLSIRSFSITTLDSQLPKAPAAVQSQETPDSSEEVSISPQITNSNDSDDAETLRTVTVDFGPDEFKGGWYQDGSAWYGRVWTALYGAYSEYPTATLAFSLTVQPEGDAVFWLTGLDDENSGNVNMAIIVNGVTIFQDPSPFISWDGNFDNKGVDAEWVTLPFTIQSGILHAGANRIVISNLEPSSEFSAPPWLLFSDAAVEVTGY